MPTIGIDLGTTYSCVGVFHEGTVEIIPNEIGRNTTPSHVAFEDEGTAVVGETAKTRADINPQNAIFDVKRLIGRKFTDPIVQKDIQNWPFKVIDGGKNSPMISLQGRTLLPEQISARILHSLKTQAEEFLRDTVTDAVITVPAYFNDGQRQATKDAGAIAGLNVLRIINEPTAAAIAYNFQRKSNDLKTILVFDFGGGTFDISILKMHGHNIDVKGVGGDTHLGGEDFDNVLLEYCIQEFKTMHGIDLKNSQNELERTKACKFLRRLKNECENQKIHLSTAKAVIINLDAVYGDLNMEIRISRETFDNLNKAMFDECIKIMEKTIEDISLSKDQIDEVILVGGSSKIPAIKSRVTAFFGGKKPLQTIRGDEAVAYGAAILANTLVPGGEAFFGTALQSHYFITDVCPLPVGIKIHVEKGDTKDFSCIIKKNTKLPCQRTETYRTVFADQKTATISIYEGEHDSVAHNYYLGEFEVTDLPIPSPKGEPIQVTMDINAEGILNVSAICPRNGAKNLLPIKATKWRMSAKEIEDKMQEMYMQTKRD